MAHTTAFTLDELRPLPLLDGLPDSQLQWLCDHGQRITLAEGERMFEHGQVADYMFVVVRGTVERFEKIGGQWLKVAVSHRGEVTGMLPYSRMTHYPGHAVAAEPSEVLRVDKADFPAMLEASEVIGQRLVAVMSDRVRGDVRMEQQAERMAALGRLAAGLAHELNNPAAAAKGAARNLAEQRSRLGDLFATLVRCHMGETDLEAIERFRAHAAAVPVAPLSAIDRSDREDRFLTWLDDHGVDDAGLVSATLTDSDVTIAHLDGLAAAARDDLLPVAVTWVAESVAADRMVDEILSSTGRISDLVSSIKTYSHMDRSAEHKPTDVREGLDNTLTMLGHKIKAHEIAIERAYQDALPDVSANAGELNQVWTNLIDNAIDAMGGGGTLHIVAAARDGTLEIKVIDSGSGIPDDIRPHIFEPFFTTKDVGEGTGLGLDIVLRVVRAHGGQVDVDSKPGRTEFRVLLPVEESVGRLGGTASQPPVDSDV